jgi:hypothetical protein
MQIHSSFKSATFYLLQIRRQQQFIFVGNKILLNSHVLQPYSKQKMTQETALSMPSSTVCVRSIIHFQLVQKLLDHMTYKH